MATIALMSSEKIAEVKPRLTAKAPRSSESSLLKRPPQAAIPGFRWEAPSVLHFTQLKTGGLQITSLMT